MNSLKRIINLETDYESRDKQDSVVVVIDSHGIHKIRGTGKIDGTYSEQEFNTVIEKVNPKTVIYVRVPAKEAP